MSFLARIAARAAPVSRAAPVLMPKDAGLRRAAAPEEEMPDEEIPTQRAVVRRVPIRRAEPEQKDEELTRQLEEPEEEEPVARQEMEDEEPEAQRATAPEDEGEEEPQAGVARTVARQAQEEEDENLRPARPLTSADMSPENQRLPDEVASEPEPPDLRTLRRAAPEEDEMEPEAARAPAEMAEDEDDANMRPLRRAVGPIAAAATAPAAPGVAVTDMATGMDAAAIDVSGDYWRPGLDGGMLSGDDVPAADFAVPIAAPTPSAASFGRPQVIIDQLDVVIHEPVAAPARTSRFDAGRALRARYLRRL